MKRGSLTPATSGVSGTGYKLRCSAKIMMLAIVDNSEAIFRIALVLVSLMGVCIVCLVVALWMRKWVKDSGPIRPNMGFTLSDLRQMHKSGQITAEEFEKAKEKILAAARRNLVQAKTAKPGSAPIRPAQPNAQDPDGAGGVE
jgi:hypothetical protein